MRSKVSLLPYLILFFVLSLGLFSGSVLSSKGFASNGSDMFTPIGAPDDEVEDLNEKIEELEKKVSELSSKEKSLQNEIASFDNQIALTELKIRNANAEITKRSKLLSQLVSDIGDLSLRITKLSNSIDHQQNILNERMRSRYKSDDNSSFLVVFGSDSLDNLVKRVEYLKFMEIQDRKVLEEMNKSKNSFNLQKSLFETKKTETAELKEKVEAEKRKLEAYNNELDDLRESKNQLLKITQNDEAKYQQELEKARQELSQIIGAANALKDSKPTKVKKGQAIGVQGNTGFSSGDHLHFGVYKYSSIKDIVGWNWYNSNTVDPAKKLKAKDVVWDEDCGKDGTKKVGSGDWTWPLANPVISQGYGKTCHSYIYSSGTHPAYDMYGPVNAKILAADDGDAYACHNCLGDGANGVFIFHDGGYMTIYWHLKSIY